MADNELYWLSGLLEGEGCFQIRLNHNPMIQLIMTDMDVVIMAAKIMGCHKVIQNSKNTKGNKEIYRTTLYGKKAVELMQKLYPLMWIRRKIKLRECIDNFELKRIHVRNYKPRVSYSRGGKEVWSKEVALV